VTAAVVTAHNLDAERALLGILLESPKLAETLGVAPGDLSPIGGHDVLLTAILEVLDANGTADPVLVVDHLRRRDQLNRIGTEDGRGAVYIAELFAVRGVGGPHHYVRLIREATQRRRLYEIGTRLVQVSTSQGDLDAVLDVSSDLSIALGLLVDQPLDGDQVIPGLSLVRDFVNEPSPPHSWVIPGVLERADRVMMVAGEGVGKSVLARQVCTLLAAGRHPFAPKSRIRPRRTLLVDLENPPDLVRRGLRGLVGQIQADGIDLGDRAWRWNRPGGINLRSPGDRQLLATVLERVRPDLVAIGPIYKASIGKPGDTYETAAAEVAAAIDHLRERYGCAFWIEHHVPKGDSSGRRSDPVGSGLWLRWPEFGLVLKREPNSESNVYMLDRFRGDRDVRAWPNRLMKHVGHYPWTADYDPDNQADLYDAIDEDNADALPDIDEGIAP
jgi:replicative DNA helicase